MEHITPDEINKALAVFFMCFGAGLPDELKAKIRERTHMLAAQIEAGGEPTVARLARDLADSLIAHPKLPTH